MTLHIWDFGGQEIMHATHQFFLTERSLYLLVLNGRQGQEDAEAEYWLRLIASFGGDSPVIVVLNKVEPAPVRPEPAGAAAEVPEHQGVRPHRLRETGSASTSCGEAIAGEVDRLPHLRAKFPAEWFRHQGAAGGHGRQLRHASRSTASCARSSARPTPRRRRTWPGSCTRLGVALNYRDDPRLERQARAQPALGHRGAVRRAEREEAGGEQGRTQRGRPGAVPAGEGLPAVRCTGSCWS